MGVSYFACDGGCKTVMNDAGGHTYYHMEIQQFEFDTIMERGKYCEDCATDNRYGRIPETTEEALFVLKPQDGKIEFMKTTIISYETLRNLKFESCLLVEGDTVKDFSLPPEEIWNLVQTTKKTEDLQWRTPQDSYFTFLAIINDRDHDEEEIWFFPPRWPNKQQKRIRLEDQMKQLEQEIITKTTQLERCIFPRAAMTSFELPVQHNLDVENHGILGLKKTLSPPSHYSLCSPLPNYGLIEPPKAHLVTGAKTKKENDRNSRYSLWNRSPYEIPDQVPVIRLRSKSRSRTRYVNLFNIVSSRSQSPEKHVKKEDLPHALHRGYAFRIYQESPQQQENTLNRTYAFYMSREALLTQIKLQEIHMAPIHATQQIIKQPVYRSTEIIDRLWKTIFQPDLQNLTVVLGPFIQIRRVDYSQQDTRGWIYVEFAKSGKPVSIEPFKRILGRMDLALLLDWRVCSYDAMEGLVYMVLKLGNTLFTSDFTRNHVLDVNTFTQRQDTAKQFIWDETTFRKNLQSIRTKWPTKDQNFSYDQNFLRAMGRYLMRLIEYFYRAEEMGYCVEGFIGGQMSRMGSLSFTRM